MVNAIHYQHTHYFSPPTQFDEEPLNHDKNFIKKISFLHIVCVEGFHEKEDDETVTD
ncbi:hypothetical protein [Granulicatella sp. zg-84]|uniref:hypothetical protein n=1 Tax=Granulicatella sp. zg-84 TaxID=2678503 RepID=UPI0013D6929D|nr:hypothetical protein [Granulicatella sp. zg-84]